MPRNDLTVPRFEFAPPGYAGVERVEVERPENQSFEITVHFAIIATREEAGQRGAEIVEAVLDRLAYKYPVAIERAGPPIFRLEPVNPAPNALYAEVGELRLEGHAVNLGFGLTAQRVESLGRELEGPEPPGMAMFGMFRLALRAGGDVEKFFLLYQILLTLLPDANGNDSQREADEFIRREQPGVPNSPTPRNPQAMETIYTRLRNEISHRRENVDLERTRDEIAAHVGALMSVVKRAIELRG